VAIDPAGTFAYVANAGPSTVSKIDLATDTVVATITDFSYPICVVVNSAGTFAYVANLLGNSVSKIDLATDTVVDTITVGSWPNGVAVNPAGTFAYVTNLTGGTVSTIDLATDTVGVTIPVGSSPAGVAIDPAGTFAYVANSNSNTVSKIALTAFSPQSITFAAVSTQLLSAQTVTLSATASSNLAVAFTSATPAVCTVSGSTVTMVKIGDCTINANQAGGSGWDAATEVSRTFTIELATQSITFTAVSTQLSGAQTVTLSATASSNLAVAFTSATPTVCTVSGSTVTLVTTGSCTIRANQAGGSGWAAAPQVSRTFAIRLSPPDGEVGVSIEDGDSYTNSKQVTLNLVWPEYATAVRISNDGGFASSKTQTKDLAASIDWELDDSVKGIYTKVVYVRFNGAANTRETYTDDIILDTTAPTITRTAASTGTSTITLSLAATDDITGVDNIQIMAGDTTVTKNYAKNVSVPLANLGLVVTTSSINSMSVATVKSLSLTTIKVRVSDSAGNWTRWRTVSVSGKALAPKLTRKISASPAVVAWYAGLAVPTGAKILLKVSPSTAAICRVAGTTLKGLKVGSCKVTVTVKPKKGTATSKTVTLKVTT
jgi:YVTN family beta-propeller protein